MQKSLTSLDLTVSPAPIPGSFSQDETKAITQLPNEAPREIAAHDRTNSGSSILVPGNRKQKDPARDISLQVLEKFSLVTKFARDVFGGESRMMSFDNLDLNHGPVPRRLEDLATVSTLPTPEKVTQEPSPPKASDEVSDIGFRSMDVHKV